MEYHFSHTHPSKTQEHEKFQCSGCHLPASGLLYGCNPCRYFLHEQCRNTGRWMEHPSHPKHTLNLLPKPTCPDGLFLCNGCRSSGQAFSLSCAPCKFDLHIHCASLPRTIVHKGHPKHHLTLCFELPYDESKNFWCHVCRRIIDRQSWVYYCKECDYGTHLGCAISDAVEVPYKPSSHPMSLTEKETDTRVPVQTVGSCLPKKDEEQPSKQLVEQMMDTQLEIATLQNQLTRHIAKLMSWAYRE